MKGVKIVTVVVTFNGDHWIKWCLDSLMSSSLSTEIVVVDNNSTDSTKKIIKSNYPEIRLVESEENLGFGKANNIGLKIALELNADYVFLLNQDAKIEPSTLKNLVAAQRDNKIYGVLSPIHLNGRGSMLDNYFSKYLTSSHGGLEFISKKLANKEIKDTYPLNFVNAAAWLISKECLKTVGGFDPIFYHYAEDDNYIHRLHYHKLKVGIVPNAIMYHDRENRRSSTWTNPFHREQDIFRRSLLIHSLNPNEHQNISVTQVKKHLLSRIFRSIFKFKMKDIKLELEIFKEYSSKTDTIKKHLKSSKNKGLTYLE
ncbi:MAG: glycosyltransferase family 2 protein [Algibacter sp.]